MYGCSASVGAIIPAMTVPATEVSVRSWRSFVCHILIAWLVVIAVIATFESGLHSVHHIDDEDITTCVIASGTTHVPAAEAPPVVSAPVADIVHFEVIDLAPSEPSTRPRDVHRGRAPPLPLSA
jgi:hypothetical protein